MKHLKELLDIGVLTQEEFDAKKNYILSVYEPLRHLKELMDAGVLTQEEFEKKKKQILGI